MCLYVGLGTYFDGCTCAFVCVLLCLVVRLLLQWNFQQSGYQFVRRYGSVAGGKFYKGSAEKSDQGIYTCGAVNVGGETLGNPGVYVIVDSLPPDPSCKR